MEQIFQRLQVIGANTGTKLNELFRLKVQLDEQIEDVENQIQFYRGVMEAIGQAQGVVRDRMRGEAIDGSADIIPFTLREKSPESSRETVKTNPEAAN